MWYDKLYPDLQALLKPAETEHFALEHFTITAKEADHYTAMNAIHGRDGVDAGKYVRLRNKTESFDSVVMSNTDTEKYSNLDFVQHAHGKVLIAGLGIGMILTAILKKKEVTSVIVVEKEQEILDLVATQIHDERLTVVHSDILAYTTTEKFNTIYFDIWQNICTDNWETMKLLKRKFRKNLDKTDDKAWMNCWKNDEIQWRVRDEKRREW